MKISLLQLVLLPLILEVHYHSQMGHCAEWVLLLKNIFEICTLLFYFCLSTSPNTADNQQCTWGEWVHFFLSNQVFQSVPVKPSVWTCGSTGNIHCCSFYAVADSFIDDIILLLFSLGLTPFGIQSKCVGHTDNQLLHTTHTRATTTMVAYLQPLVNLSAAAVSPPQPPPSSPNPVIWAGDTENNG